MTERNKTKWKNNIRKPQGYGGRHLINWILVLHPTFPYHFFQFFHNPLSYPICQDQNSPQTAKNMKVTRDKNLNVTLLFFTSFLTGINRILMRIFTILDIVLQRILFSLSRRLFDFGKIKVIILLILFPCRIVTQKCDGKTNMVYSVFNINCKKVNTYNTL